MRISTSLRIALTLLPLMCRLVQMDDLIRWTVKYHLPHRKSLSTLRRLVKAGILRSHRGPGGGYILALVPTEVSVAQIIEAVEGPIFPAEGQQSVRRVAKAFREQIEQKAVPMTLADLM